jgi:hypothetical protein
MTMGQGHDRAGFFSYNLNHLARLPADIQSAGSKTARDRVSAGAGDNIILTAAEIAESM